MTDPKTGPNDKELHRYADGDLSPAELATLMKQAALDPTVATRIGGVLEVGDLVREISEQACAELDADAMFALIEADLSATSSADISTESLDTSMLSKRPALRVIDGGGQKKPAGAAGVPAAGVPATRVPATRVPAEVGRRRIIGAVIGALAVAAAAAIALSQWGNDDAPEVADGTETVVPATPTVPEVDDVAVAEHHRTEVLEVDFGTNVGTIFAVEGTEGRRYAVVWLDDGGSAND